MDGTGMEHARYASQSGTQTQAGNRVQKGDTRRPGRVGAHIAHRAPRESGVFQPEAGEPLAVAVYRTADAAPGTAAEVCNHRRDKNLRKGRPCTAPVTSLRDESPEMKTQRWKQTVSESWPATGTGIGRKP